MNAMQPAASVSVNRPCPSCNRDFGPGMACQYCQLVEGLAAPVHLSSPGKRLGAHVVDTILMVVTVFIGWFVWSLVVWTRGQTPGKQLLGMRTVRLRNGKVAGWGTMFLREIIAKGVIGLLGFLTFGIIYFWLIWDKNNQELWDKVIDTVVVDDPHGLLAPGRAHEIQPSTAQIPPGDAPSGPVATPARDDATVARDPERTETSF